MLHLVYPCESMAAVKVPSWEKAVDIAHHTAPSKGEPCLLIRIAVAAAAQQVCETLAGRHSYTPAPAPCTSASVALLMTSLQMMPA